MILYTHHASGYFLILIFSFCLFTHLWIKTMLKLNKLNTHKIGPFSGVFITMKIFLSTPCQLLIFCGKGNWIISVSFHILDGYYPQESHNRIGRRYELYFWWDYVIALFLLHFKTVILSWCSKYTSERFFWVFKYFL